MTRSLPAALWDMDFAESKAAAAREIALAFGVPPMMLGLPGDNTFANYAEANRSFWRQTVLPLAARTGESLVRWPGPAFGDAAGLRLEPDLDRIDALSGEREALWSCIGAADFLTREEKRQAVGYGAEGGGGAKEGWKGGWAGSDPLPGDILAASGGSDGGSSGPSSDGSEPWQTQPRVPAGSPDGGQWTSEGGALRGTSGQGTRAGETGTGRPGNVLANTGTLTKGTGEPYVNSQSKKRILYPSEFPPSFFRDRALETLAQISSTATTENPGAGLGLIAGDLLKFRQGGPWDVQRREGRSLPEFVDYATVAIGIYGDTIGLPKSVLLNIQNVYAMINSRFPRGTVMDENYSFLPRRNVENTDIDYGYYGRMK